IDGGPSSQLAPPNDPLLLAQAIAHNLRQPKNMISNGHRTRSQSEAADAVLAFLAVIELAGIRDILAKSLGTTNPINMAKATVDALKRLRRPEEVAQARGSRSGGCCRTGGRRRSRTTRRKPRPSPLSPPTCSTPPRSRPWPRRRRV